MVRRTPPGANVHLNLIRLGDDVRASITVGRAPDPPIEPGTGYFGVRLDDMTSQIAKRYGIPQRGAVVTEVLDLAGDYIGLKVWDVIVKLDFDEIANVRDLQRRIARHSLSDSVSLYIIRNGKDYGVPLVFRLDHIAERWR